MDETREPKDHEEARRLRESILKQFEDDKSGRILKGRTQVRVPAFADDIPDVDPETQAQWRHRGSGRRLAGRQSASPEPRNPVLSSDGPGHSLPEFSTVQWCAIDKGRVRARRVLRALGWGPETLVNSQTIAHGVWRLRATTSDARSVGYVDADGRIVLHDRYLRRVGVAGSKGLLLGSTDSSCWVVDLAAALFHDAPRASRHG